jgi:hypothetical protein
LQSLASWLYALASRSEPRLLVRWGKRRGTGEPSAVGVHVCGFGPVFRGAARAISRARARAKPARRTRSTRSESSQTRRSGAADQVSHPRRAAESEPAILTGNGQHEVWAASSRGASQAARLQGNAGNVAHAEAGDGLGRDSETLTGWARILEYVPGREIGHEIHNFTSDIAYVLGATSRPSSRQVKPSQRSDARLLSRPPALVKAAAPAADAAADSGPADRSPSESVTVVAVTGAVNAMTGAVTVVTWGLDPALDVTGTVPAVIAVAGCYSPSRQADGPGHVLLTTLGSLAHAALACATEVATAPRLCAARVVTLVRVDTRCIAICRVAGHVPRAIPTPDSARSRLRSEMSQGRNGPAAGQRLPLRHRPGARIVPWRQPGNRLIT